MPFCKDRLQLGIPYPSKIPSWLCHPSLDSAVNNLDPELFCARREEGSRALGNPGARLSLTGFSKKQ